jgi:hypothetical protein
MPGANPTQTAAPSFEETASAVMADVQRSLSDLTAALPGTVHRAVDVERLLSLDKKLAWQVFRLAQSANLAEAANVPSRSSVRRLLDAARRQKVPESAIRAVSTAFDRFEEFTVIHGGDRTGLISMISGVTPEMGRRFEHKVRQSLFRGNAHAWGVQAQTRVRSYIFNSRPGPRHFDDILMIQAEIGLQRLRESQPLAIAVALKTSNAPYTEGNSPPTGKWRAQSASADFSAPHPDLLTEFCSKPLPQMRPRPTTVGGIENELTFPATGRAGAVTLYSSIYMEDTGEGEQGVYFGKVVQTIPTEAIVIDLLLPTGWTDPATARTAIYARRDLPEHVFEMRKEDLLPQRENFAYLGASEGIPAIEGAPRHPDAVRHALDKLGWLGTRFDIYRCRVEYPLLHSMLFYAVDKVKK